MFSEELEKISWEETTKAIYSKTDADVRRALGKEHCDVNDFMALISPAATPYLEVMARLSQKYTMERFGKTISMFVPLYLTNSCTNSCVYCGFHISNPMKRTILTDEEKKLINKVSDEYNRLIKYSCTGCEYCLPCPQQIPIPTVLSLYNRWEIFGGVDWSHMHHITEEYTQKVPAAHTAKACVACGSCAQRCPFNLPIPDLMKKAAKELRRYDS